jgi:hypothetical protein
MKRVRRRLIHFFRLTHLFVDKYLLNTEQHSECTVAVEQEIIIYICSA